MGFVTTVEVKPDSQQKTDELKPNLIMSNHGSWQFEYDDTRAPETSSERKYIYSGVFTGISRGGSVPACAMAFVPGSELAFGVECASLSLLSSLGVGPKLLAIAQHKFKEFDTMRPAIIEEDAGTALSKLLGNAAASKQESPILHERGTEERELENQKILYDVFVQTMNAHRAGIYHRDLRCENVCVRRFGPAPADIRATIIDFDLRMGLGGGEAGAKDPFYVAPLHHRVFVEIPSRLAGEDVERKPNPMELDMGYLAVLQYHLERDGLVFNGDMLTDEQLNDFVQYLGERVGYFWYQGGTLPSARHLDMKLDVECLAQHLHLVPVDGNAFRSPQLLAYAASLHRPYLDAEDMEICMRGPEARLAEAIDVIVAAKYETYKERRRSDGFDVIERYTDQPRDFQRSNYAQAEHIPVKVRALGYLLIGQDESSFYEGSYEEVTSFTDEQVEFLAELEHERWMKERISMGWILDRTLKDRVPERKATPHLVPYGELSERMKEYDRDTARKLIPLVKSAGLMVVRPK